MKHLNIMLTVFLMMMLFGVTGSSEDAVINSREEAIKYYKEKFNAINPRAKKIKKFDFSRSPSITNEDLVCLKFFPDLTSLIFSGKNINDETFKFLQDKEDLEFISFSDTSVTGEGFNYIKKFTAVP